MARANQKDKKRKSQSSDFKHVKAKVGKRALKPANETNTEAKFATIHVARQDAVRGPDLASGIGSATESNDVQDLLSTRGRSLDDIVTNLRHPASAVRISAARGLKDAVTRKDIGTAVIRSHLAVLMPVCGKCVDDEDGEVRQLALEVLREVFSKVCIGGAQEGQGYLKPFMPLLMAHVTSALNSLDRKTQLDGTSMVQMMSLAVPSLITSFASVFLPAYTIILSHRTHSQPTSSKNDSKQTPSKNSTVSNPQKYQVLKSFLALLKAANYQWKNANTFKTEASLATNLEIKNDGHGINSLFIQRAPPMSIPLLPLRSLDDLPSIFRLHKSHNSSIVEQSGISLNRPTTCDLLAKLRDIFAEATQPDSAKQDVHEVLLILESVHLFLISCCRCNGDWEASRNKPLAKVWCQYTSLMMSIFPVLEGAFPASLVAEINLKICTTVLDANLDGMTPEPEHLEQVIAYLFGQIYQSGPSQSEGIPDMPKISTAASDESLFVALERLLMISRKQKETGILIHHKLVKAMASTFFSKEIAQAKPNVRDAIACSSTTRKFVILAKEIFLQYGWSIRVPDSESFGAVLFQTLCSLATFLGSWGSEFVFETDLVVTLLLKVVARLDLTNTELSSQESSLVDHTRSSLLPLLRYSKNVGSTFEKFTRELQRKIVGLVVMLQAPLPEMLDGFGEICARCWASSNRKDTVSPDIASQIVQSIHAIRRTIPMQGFLKFVTGSMGVTQKPFGKVRSRAEKVRLYDILRFDAAVDLVSHILCQCGPAKVLPMMEPLLEQWLTKDATRIWTADEVLTARAAISILASCVYSFEGCDVHLHDVSPKLEKPALSATCCIFKHLPSSLGIGTDFGLNDEKELAAFLEPFILLFQREERLFRSCFSDLALTIEDLTVIEQTFVVSALTTMANDIRLSASLRGMTELVTSARAIETALSSTSLDRSAGVLRALMEVHCGEATASA